MSTLKWPFDLSGPGFNLHHYSKHPVTARTYTTQGWGRDGKHEDFDIAGASNPSTKVERSHMNKKTEQYLSKQHIKIIRLLRYYMIRRQITAGLTSTAISYTASHLTPKA